MPLTKLDTAALIVIDLQKGIVGLPTVHPTSEITARAAQLARAFRQLGLPVVLVNVTGMAPGRTDAGGPSSRFRNVDRRRRQRLGFTCSVKSQSSGGRPLIQRLRTRWTRARRRLACLSGSIRFVEASRRAGRSAAA